ncbi:MAG: BMP family ABC transporter substrate-binding protein [Lachnospiraceae bacterium]|nr:BMP family ABC transporter substrate-binding protein [Lachnospiraceae bacterium]
MKKKLISLMLASAMVLSLTACGGSTQAPAAPAAEETEEAAEEETAEAEAEAEAPAEGEASDMRVAMVTDYGDITDQSFNQTTYEAAKAFCEANGVDFTYYKPEGDSDAERVAMIDKAVEDGYNVVVLPGFAFAGAIAETATMYPDLKIVALDVSEYDLATAVGADTYSEPNVFSAVYQEELAGYMAGYAAVKLGYTKLGFLGGMAVPAVQRYGYGFVQGADAAAGETGDAVEIKYTYGNQFFGDADITAAMDTWYSGGTEVVFACGGGIYTSAAEAAKKVNAKVIGVDVDQSGIIDGGYAAGMTVTSAMKGLAATVDTLLAAIKDGNWGEYAGKIENLGIVSGTDPEANYVQIPMATTQWADGFTQDDYKALVAGMADGSITVSNDISAEPAVSNVTVDYQAPIK